MAWAGVGAFLSSGLLGGMRGGCAPSRGRCIFRSVFVLDRLTFKQPSLLILPRRVYASTFRSLAWKSTIDIETGGGRKSQETPGADHQFSKLF